MTFLGALGALYLKKATMGSSTLFGMLKHCPIYIGGGLYILSLILNIYLLHYLDYSVVLPLTSITYIWTLVIARVSLKETISIFQILGVVCISAGAVLIAAF